MPRAVSVAPASTNNRVPTGRTRAANGRAAFLQEYSTVAPCSRRSIREMSMPFLYHWPSLRDGVAAGREIATLLSSARRRHARFGFRLARR